MTSLSKASADWWTAPIDHGPARSIVAFRRLAAQGFTVEAGNYPQPSAWVGSELIFAAQKGGGKSLWKMRLKAGDRAASSAVERLTLSTALDILADASVLSSK